MKHFHTRRDLFSLFLLSAGCGGRFHVYDYREPLLRLGDYQVEGRLLGTFDGSDERGGGRAPHHLIVWVRPKVSELGRASARNVRFINLRTSEVVVRREGPIEAPFDSYPKPDERYDAACFSFPDVAMERVPHVLTFELGVVAGPRKLLASAVELRFDLERQERKSFGIWATFMSV